MLGLTLPQLSGFLLAAALITLAPGPDNLTVLGLGLSRGRHAGVGFGLGCALGCFTHTMWATLGAAALIAASQTAFQVLKFAGAAYLIWLGWQALRSPGAKFAAAEDARADPTPLRAYVRRGFIANAINPKVALFFLAFLPQFVRATGAQGSIQMAALGTLFAVQTVVIFATLGWYAGAIGVWLRRRTAVGLWMDRATGVLLVGLGLRLALAERV